MHASITQLFEHLRPGLLWVGADGLVRYANRGGTRSTGLVAGRRIGDPDLTRAVVATSLGGAERRVRLVMATKLDGASLAELDCRVLPGPEGDDAFVLLAGGDEPDSAQGMDVLMNAIGRDLRDPLRSSQAALALARQGGSDGGGLELEALFDRLDELMQAADRLADLAALWGGGSQLADDRVELWPLLQQVWSEVEPMALSRQVRVRFTSDAGTRELATLYGSDRWLRRVFVECLQGAVRVAEPQSALEIEHVQHGARACIVLRHTRLFAAGARGPDAVSRQLCRHVLALHGGRLREEVDGTSRHLVIELPTGAPNRGDDPELGIAQAQRYAHDLAELMGRRRRTRPTERADAV